MLFGHSVSNTVLYKRILKVIFSFEAPSYHRSTCVRHYRGAPGREIPWNRKESKLYWRGSTTGGHAMKENYKDFQRHRLMSFRERNASLFDVAFTATVQCGWLDCWRMKKKYPFVGRVDFVENFENKYLLDIVSLCCFE
jgi:hypothetical protein